MMAFLLSIILLSAFIFGFRFSIELIVDAFPEMGGLFYGNGAAIAIFALSLITSLPFFYTLPIAIIVGIFFAKVWYSVALHYLALEGVWLIFNAIITILFGTTIVAFFRVSKWFGNRDNVQ